MRRRARHLREPRVSALLHASYSTHPYSPRPVTPTRAGGPASVLSNDRTTPSLLQMGADRLRGASRSALRNSIQATHRRQPLPMQIFPRWSNG